MSGTSLLVFVVTLMSIINHSYTVELPNISDKTFEDYKHHALTTAGRLLDEKQFKETLTHYNIINDNFDKLFNDRIVEVLKELYDSADEIILLDKMMTSKFTGCGDRLKITLEKYIIEVKEKNKYTEERLKFTSHFLIQYFGKQLPTNVKEIEYLKSLLPLTSNTDGRIKQLKLNTLYGSIPMDTDVEINTRDKSEWFHHLKKLDPLFGEPYGSYKLRMMHHGKMPLPLKQIPTFYGNGKFKLFEEFDIWPELDAVFVMYYLSRCDFKFSEPSQDKPAEQIQPIIEQSDE